MKLINPASQAGAKDLVNLLYETALINSGFTLENTGTFAERIFRIVQMGLGLDAEFNEVLESEDTTEGGCSTSECSESCKMECKPRKKLDASGRMVEVEEPAPENEDEMEEVD